MDADLDGGATVATQQDTAARPVSFAASTLLNNNSVVERVVAQGDDLQDVVTDQPLSPYGGQSSTAAIGILEVVDE